jgi:hypothetical protein
MVEDDVAGRVAWAVADVEVSSPTLTWSPSPSQRSARTSAPRSRSAGLLLEALDPERVLLVRPFDRDANLLGEDPAAAWSIWPWVSRIFSIATGLLRRAP